MALLPPFRLTRPDDQLVVDVTLSGLVAVPAPGPTDPDAPTWQLQRATPTTPGRIWLRFQPQQVIEYAADAEGDRLFQDKPIHSPPTDVVVEVPVGSAPIPLSIEGLLERLGDLPVVSRNGDTVDGGGAAPIAADPTGRLAARRLRQAALAPRAPARFVTGPTPPSAVVASSGGPTPQRPSPSEPDAGSRSEPGAAAVEATPAGTEVAMPYRLAIAVPGGDTRLRHVAVPSTSDGRVELWHTTLVVRSGDGAVAERPVPVRLRAAPNTGDPCDPVLQEQEPTGSPGWAATVDDDRIQNTLRAFQARKVACQSQTTPALLHRLRLSTLGGWLDLRGRWPGATVSAFSHNTAMGRDQAQRIITSGRLYPFGHRVVLTSETGRVIEKGSTRAAALHTIQTLTVVEPTVGYPDVKGAPLLPFASITILDATTPAGSTTTAPGGSQPAGVLEFTVRGRPHAFRCVAVDRAGEVVTFAVPLLFVPDTSFASAQLSDRWRQQGADYRRLDLGGQPVAVAPSGADEEPTGSASDATRAGVPAAAERATTVLAETLRLDIAGGEPVMEELTGVLPSLERHLPGTTVAVAYAADYLANRFDALNPGQVFLEILPDVSAPIVEVASDAVGGLARLRLPIGGVSRQVGAVAGAISDVANGELDLESILRSPALGDLLPDLLGVVPIADLLADAAGDLPKLPLTGADGRRIYQLVSDVVDGVAVQDLTWDLPLFGGPDDHRFAGAGPIRLQPLRPVGQPDAPNRARMRLHQHTEVESPVGGGGPVVRSRTECSFEQIELEARFNGEAVVTVPFTNLTFVSVNGKTPEVDVNLARIRFGGILGFVSRLAELIDDHGFSDPPALDITDEGVTSSFSFPVPSIAIGMFALENITIGAALDLRFSGTPVTLGFSFATPDNPFRVAVGALGGGGSLAIGLSTQGLTSINGSLEFGAAVSLDLVVARASVEAMGGVSFVYRRQEGGEIGQLTAFFRIHGELDVLSLISVSVDLMLALEYVFGTGPDAGKLVGYAELAVEVKLIFFSETVKVPVRQKFAGSSGDPTFAQLMVPEVPGGASPWDSYCGAFTEVRS